jgi:hypothetical protein
MTMRSTIAGLLSVTLLSLLAGCQATTPAGPVTAVSAHPGWENGPALGLAMPDIQYTAQDGTSRSLHGDSGEIALVAFVRTGGDECDRLLPSLVNAAERYYNQPVRVVQMGLPDDRTPRCGSCVESGQAHRPNLIALCDGGRQASAAFGNPAPGTLVLANSRGRVIEVTRVDNLPRLLPRVDELALAAQRAGLSDYARAYAE